MTKITHRMALGILNSRNHGIKLYIKQDDEFIGFKLSDDCHYILFDKPIYDGECDYWDEDIIIGLSRFEIYIDKELDENGRIIL